MDSIHEDSPLVPNDAFFSSSEEKEKGFINTTLKEETSNSN